MHLLPVSYKRNTRIERRYLSPKNQDPEPYYIKYVDGVPQQAGPDFTHITPECHNGKISRGANNRNTGIMTLNLDNGDKVTLLKVKLGEGMRGAY